MADMLNYFTEIFKFIMGQFTGLFTAITGDTLLYTIVLVVVGLGLCGTVIGILRSMGLRSKKGKKRMRR